MPRKGMQNIRVVFLGGTQVGKTSIIQRLMDKDFEQHYTPTVYDVHQKRIYGHQMALTLEMIDTAGLYCCPPMMKLAIAKADIIIFVYSVIDPKSVKAVCDIRKIVHEVRGFLPMETPMAVIANKVDDTPSNVQQKARFNSLEDIIGMGTSFMATSAKFNYGLKDLLSFLSEEGEIFARMRSMSPGNVTKTIRWQDTEEGKKESDDVFDNALDESDVVKKIRRRSFILSCMRSRTSSTSPGQNIRRISKKFNGRSSPIRQRARITHCRDTIVKEFAKFE